jgi:hypothetical protein
MMAIIDRRDARITSLDVFMDFTDFIWVEVKSELPGSSWLGLSRHLLELNPIRIRLADFPARARDAVWVPQFENLGVPVDKDHSTAMAVADARKTGERIEVIHGHEEPTVV